MKITDIAVIGILFLCLSTEASTKLTVRPGDGFPSQLAVRGARMPFLSFTVVADKAHLIDGFYIVSNGEASSKVISQVVVENNGRVIGTGTLGTNDAAEVTVNLVLVPGVTNNITVAGDMAFNLIADAQRTISLGLTGILHDPTEIDADIVIPVGTMHTVCQICVIGNLLVTPERTVIEQNIAGNASAQLLGGFHLQADSTEAMTVGAMIFDAYTSDGNAQGYINNAVLVDEKENIVAGPFDATFCQEAGRWTVIFTDTVVVPKGGGSFYLKGKVSNFKSDTRMVVTTRPKSWRKVRGLTYGYEIVPRSEYDTVISAAMTVKVATLDVSVWNEPDRTIIAGSRQARGLRIRLDTAASGEAVRTTAIPLVLTIANGGKPTDITNVGWYDGNTPLVTGSNVLNPVQQGAQRVNIDGSGLVIQVGTAKDLILRFDLATSAVGTYQWSVPTNLSGMGSSGVTTGNTIVPTLVGNGKGPVLTVFGTPSGFQSRFNEITILPGGTSFGLLGNLATNVGYQLEVSSNLMTWTKYADIAASGLGTLKEPFLILPQYSDKAFFRLVELPETELVIKLDDNNPPFQKVLPGTTNLTLLRLCVYNARPERIELRQLSLQAIGAQNLVNQTTSIWHTGAKIGTADFPLRYGNLTYSYSSLFSVVIESKSSVVLEIKGDVGLTFPSGPVTVGEFVKIDYDGDNIGINGTYAVGADSGMNIPGSNTDTQNPGVQIGIP